MNRICSLTALNDVVDHYGENRQSGGIWDHLEAETVTELPADELQI